MTATILAALVLSACTSAPDVAEEPLGPGMAIDAATAADVGPEGATVDLDAVSVTVPPGAVPDGERVTVAAVSAPSPAGELLGPAVAIVHPDTALGGPVTATFDISGLDDLQRGTVDAVRWSPETQEWVPASAYDATVEVTDPEHPSTKDLPTGRPSAS